MLYRFVGGIWDGQEKELFRYDGPTWVYYMDDAQKLRSIRYIPRYDNGIAWQIADEAIPLD